MCSSTNWRGLRCDIGYLIFVNWIADERSFTKTHVKKLQGAELTVRRTSNSVAVTATYQCKSMQKNNKICNYLLTLSHDISCNDINTEFCNHQEFNSTVFLKVERHPCRADRLPHIVSQPIFSHIPLPLIYKKLE